MRLERPDSTPVPPTVLVIGSAERLEPLRTALTSLEATVTDRPWDDRLFQSLDRTTLAVVLVPPLAGIRLEEAVRAGQRSDWGRTGGVFAVLFDALTVDQVRALYRAGATSVLEWPQDPATFASLVAEIKAIEQVRGKATDANVALCRSVRARLRLAAAVPAGLNVSCWDGVVRVTGTIDGLWQRALIDGLVVRVPGVRGVVTEGLSVRHSGLPDAAVAAAVQKVLEAMPSVDDESLTVEVDQGVVELAGSVASRQELDAVLGSIADVWGVRGIDSLVVISPRQRDADCAVARRLQGTLTQLCPGQRISVRAFGGMVVLRGVVTDLATSQRVEACVAEDDATLRVINKLAIR